MNDSPDILVLIRERRQRLDERAGERFLNWMLGLLGIVVFVIVFLVTPPGTPR